MVYGIGAPPGVYEEILRLEMSFRNGAISFGLKEYSKFMSSIFGRIRSINRSSTEECKRMDRQDIKQRLRYIEDAVPGDEALIEYARTASRGYTE